METKPVPYRKFVCVCTNTRPEGRAACADPGRDGGAAKAGLKGQVRVTRSGCLGLREHGPNLLVYPEGEWRSGVKPSDEPEILKGLGA
ncbi:MAG: (2Fe-2S) ferredoxin domain-containing protein [Elusimicrobia bacterium]|nr:(2Fe-2S) ferredoxin domain-containing protein [Elusimicrobiota bacterium]